MKKIILSIFAVLAATTLFAKKPVIGISALITDGQNNVGTTYTTAVRNGGGVPVILPLTGNDEQIAAYVDMIDGLVMTGGADYNPALYGEEAIKELGTVQAPRDEFDVKLIRAAVAKGIPVLGICRGMQLMAVAFGGNLWQDIPAQVKKSYIRHRQTGTAGDVGIHSIAIEKDSFLEKTLKTDKIHVNSFHHQAIKTPSKGFKVVATAPDGIVEAVERVGALDSQYKDGGAIIVGCQFHPEGFCGNPSSPFVNVFKYLVEQASKTK